MNTNEFQITGMTCGHCEASVRTEVEKVRGVDAVEVDATTGRLRVSASNTIDAPDVLEAIDRAGYRASAV